MKLKTNHVKLTITHPGLTSPINIVACTEDGVSTAPELKDKMALIAVALASPSSPVSPQTLDDVVALGKELIDSLSSDTLPTKKTTAVAVGTLTSCMPNGLDPAHFDSELYGVVHAVIEGVVREVVVPVITVDTSLLELVEAEYGIELAGGTIKTSDDALVPKAGLQKFLRSANNPVGYYCGALIDFEKEGNDE